MPIHRSREKQRITLADGYTSHLAHVRSSSFFRFCIKLPSGEWKEFDLRDLQVNYDETALRQAALRGNLLRKVAQILGNVRLNDLVKLRTAEPVNDWKTPAALPGS